jgi:glycosyltransferase involved in cell wall biosynthesis
MSHPLVSVYLPTRNRQLLLREAIESVLVQDYRNLELIIVDDASTDETPNVLSGYASADPRIKWIRLSEARGAPVARNIAIRAARGALCTGIDDDDLMMPTRLSQLVSQHDARYAFNCTGYIAEDEFGRRRINCRDELLTLEALLFSNRVGNQAMMLRDRVLAIGGFDEDMPASQDHDLWVRLVAKFGSAKRIRTPTYIVRESSDRQGRITSSPNALKGALRFTEKHRSMMSAGHLKARNIVHHYLSGEPLTISILLENLSRETLGMLPVYASRHFPLLKRSLRKLR